MQQRNVCGLQRRVGTQTAVAARDVLREGFEIDVAARVERGIRPRVIARLDLAHQRLHRFLWVARGEHGMLRDATRLHPRDPDQKRGESGDRSYQSPFHERQPPAYAPCGASRGNVTTSRARRGSGSNITNRIARKLLPIGRMPQSKPSHGAGTASDGTLRAGGASSFDHTVIAPES